MAYSIGVKGQKWGDLEKQQWLNSQIIKRLYNEEVKPKILALKEIFEVGKYGRLSYQKEYNLYYVKTKNWNKNKPIALITGGVHGYETSGVHGAIRFLETVAKKYEEKFNIICLPCISPWAYETINRWNPNTIDPNRSFYKNSSADESRLALEYIESLNIDILMHIDLHETTDTDNTEFSPALLAKNGMPDESFTIPDGFYLVGDSNNPKPNFQKAIINSVRNITHIAPTDENGQLIEVDIAQEGVINYDIAKENLCVSISKAEYVTTTEVYPDSLKATAEECILAQVEAIIGGLQYLINKYNL